MLNRIIQISLNNRLLVLLGAAALMTAGLFTMRSMDVDVFPDLSAPTVTVLTEAHGMETEEVERLVTYQIETALGNAPNVRRIRSSSASGISIVWVEFEWGTDIYLARQVISEKLPGISEKLPSGVAEPTMAPITSIMGEIMMLGITSDTLSPMELRTLTDWEITPRLRSIPGIANVIVIGGEFKQYQVLANPAMMDHYQVSLQELELATQKATSSSSGGFYSDHGNTYVITGQARIKKESDLSSALVKKVAGKPVRISDVAKVQIGPSDKIGEGSMNGSPAVVVTISKQPNTNTLDLTEQLEEVIEDLKTTLPKGIVINDHVFRQADFIEASVDNLEQTLLEGILFVVLVLFVFLMNWRTTLISLLAIPFSLLVSIIVLKLLGYTINTMILGGMAIAIGALVDDAIIDVENVFKRLRENHKLPSERRMPILTVVFEASKEIRGSILIATLIVIVAFVPLFMLGGMEGLLLQPLGIAFITSILSSLIVAVTITPILCSYLLKNERLLSRPAEGSRLERFLRNGYGNVLSGILRFPRTTVLVTLALFAVCAMLIFGLGRSFLPEFNEGSMVVSVVGPPGMSLEESNKVGELVEETLLSFDEVKVVTRRTGRAELDEHAQGVNASEIDAPFVLDGRSKEVFLAEVREKLSMVPGVNITIGQPIAHRIDHMLSGTRANIAIKIIGPDLNRMFSIGNQIKGHIEGISGLVDISVEQQIEVPQVRIRPRREMLAQFGLTAQDLTDFVDGAFAGEEVAQVYEGQRSFDLVVRLAPEYRNDIDRIKGALVDLPDGGKVRLQEIAIVESISGPFTVNRENLHRKVVVSANVSDRDLKGAVDEIKRSIKDNVSLPGGYRIEYGGQFENEEEASRILLLASIASIVLIFALLYFEFKNWTLAALVMLNLPLALAGGIVIVYLTSGIVSIASTIGFISLFGITARNGIILIARYQYMEQEGKSLMPRVVSGSTDRLTPILMTAFTTALALIPLVLKGGEPGNEIQSPMALVILGGLLTATVLNLLVMPCLYLLFEKRREGNQK